jgi:hypothetical protein
LNDVLGELAIPEPKKRGEMVNWYNQITMHWGIVNRGTAEVRKL